MNRYELLRLAFAGCVTPMDCAQVTMWIADALNEREIDETQALKLLNLVHGHMVRRIEDELHND